MGVILLVKGASGHIKLTAALVHANATSPRTVGAGCDGGYKLTVNLDASLVL